MNSAAGLKDDQSYLPLEPAALTGARRYHRLRLDVEPGIGMKGSRIGPRRGLELLIGGQCVGVEVPII
jgi:hypothetical protein